MIDLPANQIQKTKPENCDTKFPTFSGKFPTGKWRKIFTVKGFEGLFPVFATLKIFPVFCLGTLLYSKTFTIVIEHGTKVLHDVTKGAKCAKKICTIYFGRGNRVLTHVLQH